MSTVPLKILIVDDDPDFGAMLGELLSNQGHTVSVALNGAQALAKARQSSPDAVLLDLGLPDLAGYDIAKAMRAEGLLQAGSIIIVLTAHHAPELDRASAVGVDVLLNKPVDFSAIIRLVEFVHGRRLRHLGDQGGN